MQKGNVTMDCENVAAFQEYGSKQTSLFCFVPLSLRFIVLTYPEHHGFLVP